MAAASAPIAMKELLTVRVSLSFFLVLLCFAHEMISLDVRLETSDLLVLIAGHVNLAHEKSIRLRSCS